MLDLYQTQGLVWSQHTGLSEQRTSVPPSDSAPCGMSLQLQPIADLGPWSQAIYV